ncbi:MAG: hypothetical protein EOP04_26745, partial [Proteobacteria bacterium]
CPNPYAAQLVREVGTQGGLGGIAWHCYAGNASSMNDFHNANPNIALFETECSSGPWASASNLPSDYFAAARSLVFDSASNWSQTTIFWPLALDENFGPQNNGCSNCRGLVSITSDGSSYALSPEYYALAHIGRFVRDGAVRLATTSAHGTVRNIAFLNIDKTILLFGYNESPSTQDVDVACGRTHFHYKIPGNGTVSLRWNQLDF